MVFYLKSSCGIKESDNSSVQNLVYIPFLMNSLIKVMDAPQAYYSAIFLSISFISQKEDFLLAQIFWKFLLLID